MIHYSRCSTALALALLCTSLALPAMAQGTAPTVIRNLPGTLAGVRLLRGSALQQQIDTVRATAAENAFLQVPWRTNLTAAIGESQQQNKPMFIWAMDGNPLCWT